MSGPLEVAVFCAMMQFFSVAAVVPLEMPPPPALELPVIVQLVTVRIPRTERMAPPAPLPAAELLTNVELVMFRREAVLSLLKIAPPCPALLLLKVQPVILMVAPTLLQMPPPLPVPALLFRIVLLFRLIVPVPSSKMAAP